MPAPRDDSMMNRFDDFGLRRFRARDAVLSVFLVAVLLVLFAGRSVLRAGEEMNPGIGRSIVVTIGRPTSWIADRLPLQAAAHHATAFLNPNAALNGPGAFTSLSSTQVPAVTPSAFPPGALGAPQPPKRHLGTLDSDLASDLIPKGVHVIQDPHIGTGISTTFILNWGKLAVAQVKADHPNAVVVFIGANDGFPMPGPGGRQISCCGAQWAAIYADRVRQIANTYRQGGAAHIYWLTLPTPRDTARARISRVVNAAIKVGIEPYAAQVQVIDTVPIFTPGGAYRDAMKIHGVETIIRQPDGIHLNDAGSSLLAQVLLSAMRQSFAF
jgi:lysophospholipase L1-like esterase